MFIDLNASSKTSTITSSCIVCHNPDYRSLLMNLDAKSAALFERAKPGQGFVGIMEMDTGMIYLFPAYNHDDGLLRVDSHGEKWEADEALVSTQKLGTLTGDLHRFAVSFLERQKETFDISKKSGNRGLLVGFGLWKSGVSVKFSPGSELPATPGIIPNEFYVLEDKHSDVGFKVYYFDENRDEIELSISEYKPLEAALRELKNLSEQIPKSKEKLDEAYIEKTKSKIEELEIEIDILKRKREKIASELDIDVDSSSTSISYSNLLREIDSILQIEKEKRDEIYQLSNDIKEMSSERAGKEIEEKINQCQSNIEVMIREIHGKYFKEDEGVDDKIKYIKFRSSSQNMFTFLRSRLFMEYFTSLHSNHTFHAVQMRREAPYDVAQEISMAITEKLHANPINLLDSKAVPDWQDGFRSHLESEIEWNENVQMHIETLFTVFIVENEIDRLVDLLKFPKESEFKLTIDNQYPDKNVLDSNEWFLIENEGGFTLYRSVNDGVMNRLLVVPMDNLPELNQNLLKDIPDNDTKQNRIREIIKDYHDNITKQEELERLELIHIACEMAIRNIKEEVIGKLIEQYPGDKNDMISALHKIAQEYVTLANNKLDSSDYDENAMYLSRASDIYKQIAFQSSGQIIYHVAGLTMNHPDIHYYAIKLAVCLAISLNRLDIIEDIIIEKGIVFNCFDILGIIDIYQPKIVDTDMIVSFLDKAEPVDVGDAHIDRLEVLNFALDIAVLEGDEAQIMKLLKAGADINYINDNGLTPLMIATEQNKINIVKLLVDQGADIAYKNKDEITAIKLAYSHPECLAILYESISSKLEEGGKAHYKRGEFNEAAEYFNSLLNLYFTVGNSMNREIVKNPDIVIDMIKSKTDDPQLHNFLIVTAMVVASQFSMRGFVNQLARKYENIFNYSDVLNLVKYTQPESIPRAFLAYLLDNAKNVKNNDQDIDLNTILNFSLIVAVKNYDHDEIEDLLSKLNAASAINDVDEQGRTPLMHATEGGDYSIVMQLLKNGADPTAIDTLGNTALSLSTDPECSLLIKAALAKQIKRVDEGEKEKEKVTERLVKFGIYQDQNPENEMDSKVKNDSRGKKPSLS